MARVAARIEQLGIKETTALKLAGLTGDEIRTRRKRGPRIDTIMNIAKALRWTLGQAVGLQDPMLFLDREVSIDPTKLAQAMQITQKMIGERTDIPLGDMAEAVSLVYSTLSDFEVAGVSVEGSAAEVAIDSMLRRLFAK